jgi:hypothetical protein
MSNKTKSIPILEATNYVEKWQSENSGLNKNGELIHAKAFLIPARDLIDCLIEMEILKDLSCINTSLVDTAGIRAYMGIDRPSSDTIPSAKTEKLVLVATTKEVNDTKTIHRDIIEGYAIKNPPPYKLIGTGIFDFTEPCPTVCDPKSPLYNP